MRGAIPVSLPIFRSLCCVPEYKERYPSRSPYSLGCSAFSNTRSDTRLAPHIPLAMSSSVILGAILVSLRIFPGLFCIFKYEERYPSRFPYSSCNVWFCNPGSDTRLAPHIPLAMLGSVILGAILVSLPIFLLQCWVR